MLIGPLHEIDLGLIPAPSGAGALLLHGEEEADCLVVFMASNLADRTTTAAIAMFEGCVQSVFGYPNDEAYSAIPEASYGFFEVVDSDWPARLARFNRLQFPDTQPDGQLRHYFMGCHDASGQFLARGLSVEAHEGGWESALNEGLRRYLV